MADRLQDKVAVIVGAGQSPGETMGNGRATALLFAREGAHVVAVDRDLDSARETVDLIEGEGGQAMALQADVSDEATVAAAVVAVLERHGRVDVLHNNVGISVAGGDAPLTEIDEAAFDRVMAVNLRGMVVTCKHVVLAMRRQQAGAIINISSVSAAANYPNIAYKTSKAGVVALTQQLALDNARYGVRANCILPGLMDTPMAVDTRARLSGRPRAEIAAERDAKVPLRGKMGSAWDVAYAALYLASDEAGFVTGVALPVDGGSMARVG